VLASQSSLHASDRELPASIFGSCWRRSRCWRPCPCWAPVFTICRCVQHDYYSTRAEDNRISVVPIVPNRGVIVDRAGIVLARNYSAFTLEITPSKVDDLEATIDGLR
jgi:hypothetical protein